MRVFDVTLASQSGALATARAPRRFRGFLPLAWLVAVLATIVASIPIAPAATDEDPEARPLGEVSPDKALVYLIRPGAYVGGAVKSFVYSDQVFLGVLRNSSYAFAHVEPGEHILWSVMQGSVMATERFEFMEGKTYHLMVEVKAIHVVPEEQARGMLQEVKSYRATTDEDIEDAKRILEKRWAKAQAKDAAKPRAHVEKMVAEAPPADLTGKVRIPKGTTVTLEILENISSALSQPGDTVRFRVVDDLVVEGTTFLHAGTGVEAKLRAVAKASGGGQAGAIDIAFPGVRTADGSPVPLVGQVAATGKDRSGSSAGSAAAGGLLGGIIGASIKGGEALVLIGARYDVSIPVDVWVDPARVAPPAAVPAGVPLPELDLPSSVREIECKLKTACRGLDGVVIQLRSEQPLSSVAIRAIGGRQLPSPITASMMKREKDGSWTCTFPGWSVVRYLPLHEGSASSPIEVQGRLENGTAFKSYAMVPVAVRQ